MDFFSLSRKELQFLSKKNKIPANQTNLAMAEALSSLSQVEGLDEILNPVEAYPNQLQEEKAIETPNIHHSRTSTRRKDVNVSVSISTRRKKKDELVESDEKPIDHMLKTPAAPATATRQYNTRRSTRFLEKNLSKMSLIDSGDLVGSVKFDEVSHQTQDSVEPEQHDSDLKLVAISKTCNDSIEVKEVQQDIETDFVEPEDSTAPMEVTNQDIDAFNSPVVVPEVASMDVTDNQGHNEVASMEVTADHDVADLTVEVPVDASIETINALVDADVTVPEEIDITKQESSISFETMKGNLDEVSFSTVTAAPIFEQKTNDIPIQPFVAVELKGESYSPAELEPKDIADEHIEEEDKNQFDSMKENSLQEMSIGQLKKMLKNLKLDGKPNSKDNNVAKEMDVKRTALQPLLENKMIGGETKNGY